MRQTAEVVLLGRHLGLNRLPVGGKYGAAILEGLPFELNPYGLRDREGDMARHW
jgi:hypothetical protein